MKKNVMLCVLLLLAASNNAFAHPPGHIDITYEPNSQTISVLVEHNVGNPRTHFIKEIDVSLNGKRMIEDKFTRQSNDNDQSADYEIPDLKKGDTITVDAYCSISGQNSTVISIK